MITLTNVTKQFNGITAVEDLNFQVKRGEIVGLLGPNGAGKTTTLRMITGVLPPSKGDIEINNMDMKTQGFKIKKDIGFLPENNPLYEDLTVEEHLNFWACLKDIPQNKKDETINYVLKNTGIGEVYSRGIRCEWLSRNLYADYGEKRGVGAIRTLGTLSGEHVSA